MTVGKLHAVLIQTIHIVDYQWMFSQVNMFCVRMAQHIDWLMVIHELVLGIKFGMIVGGSVPNAVLQKVGYVANQAQTPEALAAIRNLTTLLPLLVVVITMIVYGCFYHLNEEKVQKMQAEIAERNAKRREAEESK